MKSEIIGIGGNPTSLGVAIEKVSDNNSRIEKAERLFKSAFEKFHARKINDAVKLIKKAQLEIQKVKCYLFYIL